MKPPSSVARRYANALFRIAQRDNQVEAISADLSTMSGILEQSPQILDALAVPRVPVERKKAALQAIMGGQLSQDITRRFLDLLLDHGRESSLPETAQAFAILADEARGAVNADVRSASPLDNEQMTRLKSRLDHLTGKDTRLTLEIDPSLVGGLIVRIGDTVMDGSVKGYLEQVGSKLLATSLPSVTA